MNGTATTRGVSKCMRFFVIHNVITSNDVTVCLHTMLLAYVDSLSWHRMLHNVWNVCVRRSMGQEYWQGGRRGKARQRSGVFIANDFGTVFIHVHMEKLQKAFIIYISFLPRMSFANRLSSSGFPWKVLSHSGAGSPVIFFWTVFRSVSDACVKMIYS